MRNKKIECKRAKPKDSFNHSSSLLIDTLSLTQEPFYPSSYCNDITHSDNNRSLFLLPKENCYPDSKLTFLSNEVSNVNDESNYDDDAYYYHHNQIKNEYGINKYIYYKLFNPDGERISVKVLNNNHIKDGDDLYKSKMTLAFKKSIDCELSTSSENEGKKCDSVKNLLNKD